MALDSNKEPIFREHPAPPDHKYSQTDVLRTALERSIEREDADYLVWSTCDFVIPTDFFEKMETGQAMPEYCCCVLPQRNNFDAGSIRSYLMFYFVIDIFVFKLSRVSAEKFKRLNDSYLNLGWGCFEHFLSAVPHALEIETYNLANRSNIIEYENPYIEFSETRKNQIIEWRKNPTRLIGFLAEHNFSKKFSTGSMYYLFYKNTRLRDVGLTLTITLPNLSVKLLRGTWRFLAGCRNAR